MVPGDIGNTQLSYTLVSQRENLNMTDTDDKFKLSGAFMILALVESDNEEFRVDEKRFDVLLLCSQGAGWMHQWTLDELQELAFS